MTHKHAQGSVSQTLAPRQGIDPASAQQALKGLNRAVGLFWASLVLVLILAAFASKAAAQSALIPSSLPEASRQSLSAITSPEAINLSAVTAQITASYQRHAAHEGRVEAEVLVDRQGRVIRWSVEGEASPQLKAAVERHLTCLAFRPGRSGDDAIPMYVKIPFVFTLR